MNVKIDTSNRLGQFENMSHKSVDLGGVNKIPQIFTFHLDEQINSDFFMG